MSPELKIVNRHLRFPAVSLIETSPSVFIHIAAEIDSRPVFFPSSQKKKQTMVRCKEISTQLQTELEGVNAWVFKAILIPPGKGEFIQQRKDDVHVARFDLAVLIECKNLDTATRLQTLPTFIFKQSFRSYVLANFAANNVAAMPILYRLAWQALQECLSGQVRF